MNRIGIKYSVGVQIVYKRIIQSAYKIKQIIKCLFAQYVVKTIENDAKPIQLLRAAQEITLVKKGRN